MSAPSAYELRETVEWAGCGHQLYEGDTVAPCCVEGCPATFCRLGCSEELACEYCDAVVCDEHGVRFTEGDFDYRICPACEVRRQADIAEERDAVLALKPELEQLLAELQRLDRHEAYERLQRLSLGVIAA